MKRVVYLGFNDFRQYKRGVENVVYFQSSLLNDISYYIHWGSSHNIYKHKKFICISINHRSLFKYVILSLLICRIFYRNSNNLLIHSHNTLMSLFLYKKTDILTVHDGLFYQQVSQGAYGIKKCLFYVMEKVLYLRCRKVHFISNFTKEKSLYPLSGINYTLINNSSNYENAAFSLFNDRALLLEKYPFLSLQKYCFIVRSIEERARIDLILSVAKKRKNYYFVIAGKGPLLEVYRDVVEKEAIDNVSLLGFVADDDLMLLYANSDFVMVTAEYGEGFGLPIIEGYLFDKPVIASDRCAIPEVIIDSAFLFQNSSDSIVCAIDRLPKLNTYNYLSYYRRNFSNQVISGLYRKLYEECML